MLRVVATVLLCLFTMAANAESLTLAPKYQAAGKNPDGSSYTGTASVNVISDTTFSIEWKIADATYKGFGMRMNDSLAATYMIDGQPGLVIYKVQSDGSLLGTWAIKGENGAGSETLTPNK